MNFLRVSVLSLVLCAFSFPVIAFDCIIRPQSDDARLARDTGEKIVPKFAMYKACHQLRVIGSVEIFYADANAKERMTRVIDSRVDALIPASETRAVLQERSLLRSVGAILLGQERYKTGMVRGEDYVSAADVLPTGKVLERDNPLGIHLSFLAPSQNNWLRIFANSQVVFQTRDINSVTLPASVFKAGTTMQWRLTSAQGETRGSYSVVPKADLDTRLSTALVSQKDTSAALQAAQGLRDAGYAWDAQVWLMELLSK